jgi:hypothetical protein
MGGMLAATLIAIFIIPVSFYVVERLSGGRGETGGALKSDKAATRQLKRVR